MYLLIRKVDVLVTICDKAITEDLNLIKDLVQAIFRNHFCMK
jgi:hypothetical protein